MATKLSNVIGAPFDLFILEQLGRRSSNNSVLDRTQNQVLFMANKMAWARLVSSVNVVLPTEVSDGEKLISLTEYYKNLGLDSTLYNNTDSLTKRWILEAGTSIQSGDGISLRQGIGDEGAYGLGGTEELGYRPMPGLTSVQVQTMGTLGSLKQATVSFKVWNIDQLNIIEAIYFRLGYSMLLEWGHVQYIQNNGDFITDRIFGIEDPFRPGRRKEEIQQEISRKVRATSGNYDGMLGIVSNFNWAFNQAGGYDCTVRILGLGSIMDSLRVDQSYSLPQGLVKKFKKDQAAIILAQEQEKERQRLEEEERRKASLPPPPEVLVPESAPKNFADARNLAIKYDYFPGDINQFTTNYAAYRTFYDDPKTINSQGAVFFNFNANQANPNASAAAVQEAKNRFDGLWIFYPSKVLRVREGANVTLNFALIDKFFEVYYREILKRTPDPEDREDGKRIIGTYLYANYFSIYLQKGTEANNFGGVRGTSLIPISLDSRLQNRDNPIRTEEYDRDETGNIDYRLILGNGQTISFGFNVNIEVVSPDGSNYPITRRLILEAVYKNTFERQDVPAKIIKVEKKGNYVEYTADFYLTLEVPKDRRAAANLPATRSFNVKFSIVTTNPGFIGSATEEFSTAVVQQQAQNPNNGDTSGQINQADIEQVEAPEGFKSALHAMLTIIQAEVQANSGILKSNVANVDTSESTKQFYDSGVFKGLLVADPKNKGQFKEKEATGITPTSFNVVDYALKGFNSELMINPNKYAETPTVNFRDLCTAVLIRYPQLREDGSLTTVKVPVYISLGYLLAFMNNMCLVYDSTTRANSNQPNAGETRPYLYIDFNPETNFCLSTPQQFSIDPSVCMIPLQSTAAQYQALFPDNVKTQDKGNGIGKLADGTTFYDPGTDNGVSVVINKFFRFKGDSAPYQGKTMNILLNVDYLLRTIASFQSSDAENAVYLQGLLERIMVDVNKSLGNINLFRVAYRDDSNTLQILDSQWVPTYKKIQEESIMLRGTVEADKRVLKGVLPIFDTGSLAREFQFKTVTSTKLASIVAISAQAATGSINSKDHSSFSWLNKNFQDRYKPYIQDPDNGAAGASKGKTKTEASNEVKAAVLFNSHVKSLYSADNLLAPNDKVELAKNYYIERMSKVKSADPVTVSAPFIPADLEITIDGIGGIIMGNAFLIPEERMPLSLRGENGIPKVGFIVTSLTNTIEKNQWLTKFKGQMIKLRNYDGFGNLADIAGSAGIFNPNRIQSYNGAGKDYSGANQVPEGQSVNTQNFTTFYPGYVFEKGTSDINLSSLGLSPLTEAGIIDDTTKNRFNIGKLTSPVPYFIIHHTAGRGDADLVYDVFYNRGLPAQYVIDRNGQIHRFMPDGALAWHAGNFNGKSIGVEIIASNDADVLPVQVSAAIRLAHFLGFKIANIAGHGKISSVKEPDEGYKVVSTINPNYTRGYDPAFG